MRFELRPYQDDVKTRTMNALMLPHVTNVLIVLPTGAGKTTIFSSIIHDHLGASITIAHRQELVEQISLALARDGVYHRIIAPPAVIRLCVRKHVEELGESFFDANAPAGVAGVDTLKARNAQNDPWLSTVTLWVQDEAHHVLKSNKWGTVREMFPNAKGIGVTATPCRADGKGLGIDNDGVFDLIIEGETMRQLIDAGFLAEYRIFAPPNDIDLSEVNTTATGDYSRTKLVTQVRKSHIVGDVVEHYLRIAPGKSGVTFATDVETASDMADKYNVYGVPAKVLHAKTPAKEREQVVKDFKARRLLQIVNVDLLGEGFDCPAIEVVSFARPTQSYPLYIQQFGRALRILEGKTCGIIIDHVGNVFPRHGLPDAARVWSLDRRDKRAGRKLEEVAQIAVCPSCTAVFERIQKVCPLCGYENVPGDRSRPEFVAGDLMELDPETLAIMRGAVARVDRSEMEVRAELMGKNVPDYGVSAGMNRQRAIHEAQTSLRDTMARWAGSYNGDDDSTLSRRFYLEFHIDCCSAQALHKKDADILTERISNQMEGVK